MDARPHIFDLDPDQLRQHIQAWGLPAYRADQVLQWLYQRHVVEPDLMANISKADRDLLAARLRFTDGHVTQHQVATDGVQKLLVRWGGSGEDRAAENTPPDIGPRSECVMIPSPVRVGAAHTGGETDRDSRSRKTACISSQVGCPVGCRFCASGLGGLEVNLTAGQIVEQVWQLTRLAGVDRITHVVFMGMGEPLANFENVIRAVHTLTAPWGFGISARRVTISTVGLPAQIRRLADVQLPVTLAISLHAPNDDIRRQLIPWAQHVSIDQLTDAGQYYFQRTGREVTFEYTLLRGVNDRPEHARQLATLANPLRANVNLIRYNEITGLPYHRPASDDVHQFQAVLRAAGVNTHIRASRGRDIAAACGQLRHEADHAAPAALNQARS